MSWDLRRLEPGLQAGEEDRGQGVLGRRQLGARQRPECRARTECAQGHQGDGVTAVAVARRGPRRNHEEKLRKQTGLGAKTDLMAICHRPGVEGLGAASAGDRRGPMGDTAIADPGPGQGGVPGPPSPSLPSPQTQAEDTAVRA